MPRYLIERELPGAGKLSDDEVKNIAKTSNNVLAGMEGRAKWVQSFVTDDAITCVYIADNEEVIKAHAGEGGFPVTKVREIKRVIDPQTGE